MTIVMAKEEQLKFYVDGDLRDRLDKLFDDQGVSLKVGMTRLLNFLLESPEEMHPVILKQARGNGAKILLEEIVAQNRTAIEDENGDVDVITKTKPGSPSSSSRPRSARKRRDGGHSRERSGSRE